MPTGEALTVIGGSAVKPLLDGAAQEGGDGAGGGVGDREIGAAVAVEVGGDDADGIVAGRDRRLGAERAAGNPQQDRHVVAAPVGDRQVGQPVAVVVADGDRDRGRPGREPRAAR